MMTKALQRLAGTYQLQFCLVWLWAALNHGADEPALTLPLVYAIGFIFFLVCTVCHFIAMEDCKAHSARSRLPSGLITTVDRCTPAPPRTLLRGRRALGPPAPTPSLFVFSPYVVPLSRSPSFLRLQSGRTLPWCT